MSEPATLSARLGELHARAGRPSVRDISRRAGRGNVSSSTVHNVLKGARVSRWELVEQVVIALGGDRQEFRVLWEAAWQAQNDRRPRQVLIMRARVPGSTTLPEGYRLHTVLSRPGRTYLVLEEL